MKTTTQQLIKIEIITKYLNGVIHYQDAIELLNVKERQFRRIIKAFKENGILSVHHGNRGRTPPNKLPSDTTSQILSLYKTRYKGLNVVHFIEKLQDHNLKVPSYGAVRALLLAEKLISPQMKKRKSYHPRRQRYAKEGLMIQIDGSHHRWIMGMLPVCLTVGIDDATGKLVGGLFTHTETTFAAMNVVEQIFQNYGVFQLLYSDRAGIYGGGKRDGYTNMKRAMDSVGVVSLQASSPQAKGRIERVFKTLQSRLISEMRLRNINGLEEANKYLIDEFIPAFNLQFGKVPLSSELAHRLLDKDIDLNEIFCMISERKVQAGELICYESAKYVLRTGESLVGKSAEIREYRDNSLCIYVEREKKDYIVLEESKRNAA